MITDEELRKLLEKACGDNQAEWAKKHGFSRQYINRIIAGKVKFPIRIAGILGYEKVKSWVRKK